MNDRLMPRADRSAVPATLTACRRGWLPLLALSLSGLGCYHAGGIERASVSAGEIPASGGDRVAGLKVQAGAGDFRIGNDFLSAALAGRTYGTTPAGASAASAGCILDLGPMMLDSSYRQVSPPADRLEFLAPVVNQDPDLRLVFDEITPGNDASGATLVMRGGVYDRLGKLGSAGRVPGVTVQHMLRLDSVDRYCSLTTTITNNGSAAIGITNIGDYLFQRGGGYRFNIPAHADAAGNDLAVPWGVDVPAAAFAPGAGVRAPMVGLMGTEPGGPAVDYHASVGFLPVDEDDLLVSNDAQHVVVPERRPVAPQRLVAGKLPAGQPLPPGASLTYRRRIYATGSDSVDNRWKYQNQTFGLGCQATGLFNQMAMDRYSLRPADTGTLLFSPVGTAARGGPVATEIRFERQVGSAWRLERAEWLEPAENLSTDVSSLAGYFGVLLPAGTYRVSFRSALYPDPSAVTFSTFPNGLSSTPDAVVPLVVKSGETFKIPASANLCPERNADGTMPAALFTAHTFGTTTAGSATVFQPLRLTFRASAGTQMDVPRSRSFGGYFSANSRQKEFSGLNYGSYQFQAGNQVFGSSFSQPASVWLPAASTLNHEVYATRGPLAPLAVLPGTETGTAHTLAITPQALPAGWTSFDLPGPSQATSGGLLPCEKLSSALAEGVQVLANTEMDRHVDAEAVYLDFRKEFNSADQSQIGLYPFVGSARSSDLGSAGAVTALFTPAPTGDRNGGARPVSGLSFAQFMTESDGKFFVMHQPLPASLPAELTAPAAPGNVAIELIRAKGWDPAQFWATRTAWFTMLGSQTPAAFTKALGLSAAEFSLDTPVGLARTYLKASGFTADNLDPVLAALRSGAVVASTGPLLDVSIGASGPGTFLPGAHSSVDLVVSVFRPDWVPVDEVRVVLNGTTARTFPFGTDPAANGWVQDSADARKWSRTVTVPLAKDSWVVVEAGVAEGTTGTYAAGTPWAWIMRGIYPIAVTNPLFVDFNGDSAYTAPGP